MWFASAKPPYGTLDAAEWPPSTASKADICTAAAHVRFTPNSDRESEFPQRAMSALPPKADMCSALAYVRFGPRADADVSANRWLIRQAYRRVEQVRPGLQRQ